MRLVFDTNVYISAFIVPGSRSEMAFRLAERGVFELVVSEEMISELEEKLAIKFGDSGEHIAGVEQTIRSVDVLFEPEVELAILDDEPDNRILECAVVSGASAIVTGDRHLLSLKSYEGIGIMTVADLLYSFPTS